MHPILAERKRLAIYLAAWLPPGGLLALLLHLSGGMAWTPALALVFPASFLLAFVCLAAWYPVRALQAGKTRLESLAATHLCGAVIATALWLAVDLVWAGFLEQTLLLPGAAVEFRRGLPVLAGFGVLLYLLAVSIHHLLAAYDARRRAERRVLELTLLAREAELKLLRAQIDPHFLFNALNSLAALTHSDPEGARTVCLRLAEFLRAGMRLGSRDRIPLRSELELAASFLAIERIRFGQRMRVEESVDPECAACLVPPLILQPLVENAVRHGIATLVDGGCVRLEAGRGAGRLRLLVENPTDPSAPERAGEGVGLANVRQRLRLAYGSAADFQATRKDGCFRVELSLPIEIESGGAGGPGSDFAERAARK